MGDVGRCREMHGDVGRCGEMQGDAGTSSRLLLAGVCAAPPAAAPPPACAELGLASVLPGAPAPAERASRPEEGGRGSPQRWHAVRWEKLTLEQKEHCQLPGTWPGGG